MLTSTWLRALLATNRQGMTQAQQRDGLRPQAEMGWIYCTWLLDYEASYTLLA